MVTLPLSMLGPGAFPRILHAAGLASTKSEAHRLIASRGAYVVVPKSGTAEAPTSLKWTPIEASSEANPQHFLVDFEALVLRTGKSRIQVVRIVKDEDHEKKSGDAQEKVDKLEQEAKDDIKEEESKNAQEAEASAKTSTGDAVPFQPS